MNERLRQLLSTPIYKAFATTATAPATQIKATAGLGKTEVVISELARSSFWRSQEIHYYAPDHDQAAEVAALAKSRGLNAQHIRGRSPSEASPGYCARYKIAEKAANRQRAFCLGRMATMPTR